MLAFSKFQQYCVVRIDLTAVLLGPRAKLNLFSIRISTPLAPSRGLIQALGSSFHQHFDISTFFTLSSLKKTHTKNKGEIFLFDCQCKATKLLQYFLFVNKIITAAKNILQMIGFGMGSMF